MHRTARRWLTPLLGLLLGIGCGPEATVGPVEVGGVAVSGARGRIYVAEEMALSAVVTDVRGTTLNGFPVAWSSSDAAVATVDAQGRVRGVAGGAATIVATAGARSASTALTVLEPVATTTVTAPQSSVAVGATLQLTATLRDAAGRSLTERAVTWATSDATIASVSTSGLVTALPYAGAASRTVTLSATSEGRAGTLLLTVTPMPVASVAVTPASASVIAGASVTLAATTRDAAGGVLSGRTVTWSSSNTAVATVNGNGTVSGLAAGSVTITATSEGVSATSTVTVLPSVATVTVAPDTATLVVGDSRTLTATLRDAAGNLLTGRALTWSSSDTVAVRVTAAGVVTAAPYTGAATRAATIVATSEGRTGTAIISVTPSRVASVAVTPVAASIVRGATQQFAATVRDSAGNALTGRTVAWATADGAIATVSVGGLATGVAVGSTTVTASVEGRSGSATLTVEGNVATIALAPTTALVPVGATQQITATLRDSLGAVLTGRTIAWSSSSSAVASVSATGVVAGLNIGTTTITATSEGRTATASISVVAPVASISVSPTTATLSVGGTQQVSATLKDAAGNVVTGRTIAWTTSNPSVATVSATGLVTASGLGTATVTATTEGKSATMSVAVRAVATAGQTLAPGVTYVVPSVASSQYVDFFVERTSTTPFTVATFGGTLMGRSYWTYLAGVDLYLYAPGAPVVGATPSNFSCRSASDIYYGYLTTQDPNAESCTMAGQTGFWRVRVYGTTGAEQISLTVTEEPTRLFGSSYTMPSTAVDDWVELFVERQTADPFTMSVSGGSGDVALALIPPDSAVTVDYLAKSVWWNQGAVCASSRYGATTDSCAVPGRIGFWRVRLYATSAASGAVLTRSVTPSLALSTQTAVPATSVDGFVDYLVDRTTTAPFAVTTSGGSGNADLFVYPPGRIVAGDDFTSNGVYRCTSAASANAETCSVAGLPGETGAWRIRVAATAAFSGLNLLASPITPIVFGATTSVPSVSGGQYVEYFVERTTTTGFTVSLSGGTGDAELAVFPPEATTSSTSYSSGSVCLSTNSGTTESCTINTGKVGYWRIRVFAYTSFGGVSLRTQ